jgi:hypothetical protein
MAEARPPLVDLYCEDEGHELFVRALVRRLAREQGRRVSLRTQVGRGGHGRAIAELRLWQTIFRRASSVAGDLPDLLLIIIDCNCHGWSTMRDEVEPAIDRELFPNVVVGCPDPHIEKWCFADPGAFRSIVGVAPPAVPAKCERDVYKNLLRSTLRAAGVLSLTTEMEVAPDIVAAMDLFRAGKSEPSLKHLVDELRAALKRLPSP